MNTIANTASSATSTVSNFFGSAFNRVGQFAGRIWTMISNIVPSAVSSRVAKLFAPMTSVFKGLPKPIKATVVLTAAGSAAYFAVKYFKSREVKKTLNAETISQDTASNPQHTISEVANAEETRKSPALAFVDSAVPAAATATSSVKEEDLEVVNGTHSEINSGDVSQETGNQQSNGTEV